MSEWLAMGGYGFYVWSSYGMLALALIVELAGLRRHRRESWRRATAMRAERSMATATRPGGSHR
ncbi:MAG: heme exporter protein CcmD [Burkholderiaceae bacterium]|nr:heme exporter protein CcmD [Burkholderiaceae bacterium]MEB2352357.1 heme exporter protein CcmD [Burkholderiaceae bacterium]